MEPYIEIKNFSKRIKKNIVLENINMKLYRGKIYGIRGVNGSGKTMLLRAISGLISPNQGEIIIDKKVLHKEISFPQSIGILIEGLGFLPNYSGRKNLEIISSIKDIINDEDIRNSMSLVGLDYADKRKYKEYSLGMKQKLGIAQALMENPDLILLDEPTNALDESSIKNIVEIIKKEKEKNKVILITSHDKLFLENIADEIFNLENGKIV